MVASHMWRSDAASHPAHPSAVCAFGAVTYHGTGGNLRLPFCWFFSGHESFTSLVSPVAQVATVLSFFIPNSGFVIPGSAGLHNCRSFFHQRPRLLSWGSGQIIGVPSRMAAVWRRPWASTRGRWWRM